jgi:hypothetical protein
MNHRIRQLVIVSGVLLGLAVTALPSLLEPPLSWSDLQGTSCFVDRDTCDLCTRVRGYGNSICYLTRVVAWNDHNKIYIRAYQTQVDVGRHCWFIPKIQQNGEDYYRSRLNLPRGHYQVKYKDLFGAEHDINEIDW